MEKSKNANSKDNEYINIKNNGQMFPTWVMHNFKQYKLPEIMRNENEDPCNIEQKIELRKYQEFIGRYMNGESTYRDILLYHGMGSGKTATSINLMNILYNYDSRYNFIILIKASLLQDPWMKDLKQWLYRSPDEKNNETVSSLEMYKNIYFIHYDSPYAGQNFLNTMKKIDQSKPITFIVDEAHNFIRNVYSNLSSTSGDRAQVIYNHILKLKMDNKNTRVVLISATPSVNTPYELALLFNLLRHNIFPSTESEFNRIFITSSAYPILNPIKKNLFERRILGLVSYYIGATPDLYARVIYHDVDTVMSPHQYKVYRVFEKLEEKIRENARKSGRVSKLLRTYTRQASNLSFPDINNEVNAISRPRPRKFKVSNRSA